jgi:hypothetical protein
VSARATHQQTLVIPQAIKGFAPCWWFFVSLSRSLSVMTTRRDSDSLVFLCRSWRYGFGVALGRFRFGTYLEGDQQWFECRDSESTIALAVPPADDSFEEYAERLREATDL